MNAFKRFLVVLGMALLAISRSSSAADVFADATAGQIRVVTPAYFGIHFHRLVLQPHEAAVRTQWPVSARFAHVRLWDSVTRWADLAPKAGQWDFDRLDAYVGAATQHGASILYTLGSTPRWASARPDEPCPYGFGCAAESARLAHWEEYVRRIARRYKGLIGAYELWNEPYFSDLARDRAQPQAFYSGSVANMVAMARSARKILDETSPSIILATPGFVGGADRLDMFLGAGGKQYVQAIAYHFYSRDADHFVRQVLEVREVMRRHGVDHMPLWNTELGVEVHPPGSASAIGIQERSHRAAAARVAQLLILGAAVGLERFYYYAWDNERSGMVTTRGERLPSYEAMTRVQYWMLGSRMKGCTSPTQGVVSCRVEAGEQSFLIAWASEAGEHTLKLPGGMQATAVETLMPGMPEPKYRSRNGLVRIELKAEPLRIALASQIKP